MEEQGIKMLFLPPAKTYPRHVLVSLHRFLHRSLLFHLSLPSVSEPLKVKLSIWSMWISAKMVTACCVETQADTNGGVIASHLVRKGKKNDNFLEYSRHVIFPGKSYGIRMQAWTLILKKKKKRQQLDWGELSTWHSQPELETTTLKLQCLLLGIQFPHIDSRRGKQWEN